MLVRKDGKVEAYDINKVSGSILKAMAPTDKDGKIAGELADRITLFVKHNFKDGATPNQIQDLTEQVLIEEGYANIAKSFILQRERLRRVREASPSQKDSIKSPTYLAVWGEMANNQFFRTFGCLEYFQKAEVLQELEGGSIYIPFFDMGKTEGMYSDPELKRRLEKFESEVAKRMGISQKELRNSVWHPSALRAQVINYGEARNLEKRLPGLFDVQTDIYSIPKQGAD